MKSSVICLSLVGAVAGQGYHHHPAHGYGPNGGYGHQPQYLEPRHEGHYGYEVAIPWNYHAQGLDWRTTYCKGLNMRQSPLLLPQAKQLEERLGEGYGYNKRDQSTYGTEWVYPKRFSYNYDESEKIKGYLVGQLKFGVEGTDPLGAMPAKEDKELGELWIDDAKFIAKEFHFHAGAEHTIELDGYGYGHKGFERYPIEMHIIHEREEQYERHTYKKKNDLAVVGLFFVEGKHNELLDQFLKAVYGDAPMVYNTKNYSPWTKLNLNKLLRSNDQYGPSYLYAYGYPGSLTTPPCSETVQWVVLAKPFEASPYQIKHLRSLLKTPTHQPNWRLTQNKLNTEIVPLSPLAGAYHPRAYDGYRPTEQYGYEGPNYGYEGPNYGYEGPNYGYGYEEPNYGYGYEEPNYGYEY